MNPEQVKLFYSSFAQKYNQEVLKDKYHSPLIIYSWIRPLIHQNSKILDLGCGTGLSSKPFFEDSDQFEITGVDVSPEMLEKAKELPFKRLICQPIDKFENQEIFDVIVCVGVLDFIADLDNLFLRLKKNLHQKSLFGFTVPETPNDGLVGLDLQETRQLFSRTGFEVLKQEKIHGYTDSASGKVVEYWIILAQAL